MLLPSDVNDCSNLVNAALNPRCWWDANIHAFLGDSSQATDEATCKQAAGGSSSNDNYKSCIAAMKGDVVALAVSDPIGASDYNNVVSGDVVGLLNPFTGSGFLNPTNPNAIPSWALLLGVVGIGWLVLERVGR